MLYMVFQNHASQSTECIILDWVEKLRGIFGIIVNWVDIGGISQEPIEVD